MYLRIFDEGENVKFCQEEALKHPIENACWFQKQKKTTIRSLLAEWVPVNCHFWLPLLGICRIAASHTTCKTFLGCTFEKHERCLFKSYVPPYFLPQQALLKLLSSVRLAVYSQMPFQNKSRQMLFKCFSFIF